MGILRATHGSPDRPLQIGDLEIQCYVLEDGTRVVTRNGIVQGLGMAYGSVPSGADRLSRFVDGRALSAFVSPDLRAQIANPVRFQSPTGVYLGFKATILAEICEAVLEANDAGVLQTQQLPIAKRCETLVRAFAKVGIIALVDEVTGYQDVRAQQALQKILNTFIQDDLRRWMKTFPDEFYRELFRLRGWRSYESQSKRPGVVGHWTNDLVYERLAPGVLDELRRLNPPMANGRRRHRHHQHLTDDVGHPKLREHLAAVTALMKSSNAWAPFYRSLQRALPKLNRNLILPLDEDAA